MHFIQHAREIRASESFNLCMYAYLDGNIVIHEIEEPVTSHC
jgi:hypothetical protein